MTNWRSRFGRFSLMLALAGAPAWVHAQAPEPPPTPPGAPKVEEGKKAEEKPDFPPFKEAAKDYEKVVSVAESAESLYTLYKRDKDQGLLAELPRNFAQQKHFWALTVASGDMWAGLQGDSGVLYWKRLDKTLILIEPNFETRSTGDDESKVGVARQFSDRVLFEVPILCMGPGGQPVVDLKALLGGQAGKFFGGSARGTNAKLATIKEAKAFPENIEISLEMPSGDGALRTFHYSISRLPETTGYKPREADERVGYFTTSFRDLGKFRDDKKWVRYVNRWNIEKRDPNIKISPPKEPIVFYIEHTVPVRYRRFVREGVLDWNKAFEKIGISDAVEVYYQDKTTGANMEKDPEDVRYNFIRWLSNDAGTAIGPSRTDPRTGQILDADVVLTDGWIRYFWYQANELLPEIAISGMSPETLAWLEHNPRWDPRVRLTDPGERDYFLAQRARRGVLRYGGHPAANVGADSPGGNEFGGLVGRTSQFNGLCLAARGKGMDMAFMRMNLELADMIADDTKKDEAKKDDDKKDDDKKDDKKKDEKKDDLIDGIPDWFIGPMLADLVAHEVGHTLGLRHNFKASSIYALTKINSDEVKGKKAFTGSVMDYNPVNINRESGPVQGDYAMIGIGPYDMWAIEYGYTLGEPKDVLKRVAEPELAYLTDEDTIGPDPLARQYDFSAEPLDYAKNQCRLIDYYRGRLTDKFVKEGESWAKARRGYLITLSQQLQAVAFMSPWVGGAHVHRDRKGDPNARPPIEVVPVQKQRDALRFVIDHAFKDEAFGLSPDILRYMTVDKWWDGGGMRDILEDSAYPVHDRIIAIQAVALTRLLNPTTLRRVFDNEFRTPSDQDMLTLPELMNAVATAIWSEIDQRPGRASTARRPLISSLRRNLQREHLERLIDLTTPGDVAGVAAKPISNLAVAKLREIRGKIKDAAEGSGKGNLDEYSLAHLSEAGLRIDKVLDAQYIYNTDKFGPAGGSWNLFFGRPAADEAEGRAPTLGRSPGEPERP